MARTIAFALGIRASAYVSPLFGGNVDRIGIVPAAIVASTIVHRSAPNASSVRPMRMSFVPSMTTANRGSIAVSSRLSGDGIPLLMPSVVTPPIAAWLERENDVFAK